MAFPNTPILDTGSGSDSNPIQSPWLVNGIYTDGNWASIKRLSNRILGTTAGGNGERWDQLYNADQEAYFQIPVLDIAANNNNINAMARIQPGTFGGGSPANFYMATYDVAGGGVRITLYNGAFSTLGTQDTVTLSANDWLGLSCVGTSISAWWKIGAGAWTQGTGSHVTDSTISAAGYIGAEIDGATYAMTNFGGGNPGLPSVSKLNLQAVNRSFTY